MKHARVYGEPAALALDSLHMIRDRTLRFGTCRPSTPSPPLHPIPVCGVVSARSQSTLPAERSRSHPAEAGSTGSLDCELPLTQNKRATDPVIFGNVYRRPEEARSYSHSPAEDQGTWCVRCCLVAEQSTRALFHEVVVRLVRIRTNAYRKLAAFQCPNTVALPVYFAAYTRRGGGAPQPAPAPLDGIHVAWLGHSSAWTRPVQRCGRRCTPSVSPHTCLCSDGSHSLAIAEGSGRPPWGASTCAFPSHDQSTGSPLTFATFTQPHVRNQHVSKQMHGWRPCLPALRSR